MVMNSGQTLRFSIGAIVLGLAEVGGAIASPVQADWARLDGDRPDNVGLSEFVVRQWSPIAVGAAHPVDHYCR